MPFFLPKELIDIFKTTARIKCHTVESREIEREGFRDCIKRHTYHPLIVYVAE